MDASDASVNGGRLDVNVAIIVFNINVVTGGCNVFYGALMQFSSSYRSFLLHSWIVKILN